ncbi:MAG: N-acetyltransferase [Bifidobacteriaceae bacterium]|jgi:predicted GNAT family acetyltransferase|nr:N-acetyltransferase [Bifidobacteriaceae bacterium]
MSETPHLTVRNNQTASQYELYAGRARLGLTQYQASERGLAFVHTEIAPEVGGEGLGSALVGAALDDARARGLAVLPYCTFVRHFIETHPQYLDLVPAGRRRSFGFDGELPGAAAPAGGEA